MFPLIWLLATIGIGALALAGMVYFWKLFCENRGGKTVEYLTSASLFAFLGALGCFLALFGYATWSFIGPGGIGITIALMAILVLLKRSRPHLRAA